MEGNQLFGVQRSGFANGGSLSVVVGRIAVVALSPRDIACVDRSKIRRVSFLFEPFLACRCQLR